MKLRPKIIVLLTSLFAVLGIALLVVQQRILLPSFAELEREGARTDLDRVKNTLKRDLDLLYSMTADWGNWDATYQFMIDRDPAFIRTSMTVNAIQGYRADAVALVDLSGRFVWATAIEPGSGAPMNLDVISRGVLPDGHLWQDALRTGSGVRGLLRTNRGPMLIALAPVLDGNGKGPHHGMVLLGRLITDEEIVRIGAQAEVNLSRATGRSSGLSTGTPTDALIERDLVTQVVHVFNDVMGVPALALRIDVPRTVSAHGRQVVAYATFFLIAAGAIVLLAMIVVL